MSTIFEITKDRGNEIRSINALSENFIASLEKMEQAMLNLSKTIANMNKRYEAIMKSRKCESILNNITDAN